ncbi:hypothetical protein KY284_036083 [Solanum tuberosum]|nr:hypothetical protein KY284_036083 [Solanum tuberosum]
MTREERITAMENQKVLNGKAFNPDILTKFGMGNLLDAISIQGWNHLFEPHHTCTNQKCRLDELEEINFPAIMLECECVEGRDRGRSQVANVLEQQAALKREVTDLTEILNNKEIKIATLKSKLQKAVSRGPGTSDGNEQVLQKLRDENERLLKTNVSLSEEVKALNRQIIKALEDANERMMLFMPTLSPPPPPS